jgi:electron transfer flavoprotein alpha subunit
LVRNIVVCIKQIPLIEDANFDAATKTIKRDGPNVISAFDLRAISLATDLKQRFGARTTVATMGPPQARSALIESLAMGMDRAVHLEDRAFAGSDTLATARALASWLHREPFDLILMGKYSLDAETGQVGPEIAELLGIGQIGGVRKLDFDGDLVRAERETDEGFDEIECRMPALLTCAERVAQPIKLKPGATEEAKARPVETIRAAELGDARQFGFAGSPTSVHEVRFQQAPKVEGRLIDAADPARAAAETIAALDGMGALSPRAVARKPVAPKMRAAARGKDLWVACETTSRGEITRGTLELLSRADQLAPALGGAVVALVFGQSAASHANLLAGYGADQVIVLDAPSIENSSPDIIADAVASLVRERSPWGLLLSASERGRDWGPRLAAQLQLGLTGDAIGIELDAEKRMIALKPAFGGNIVAPILSSTYPQMATVRSGVLELAAACASREARLEVVRPVLKPALSRIIKSHALLDESLPALDGAEIVVGVGTGVGGPEGVAKATELAHAMGAALCATRRVTDAGWVPRQLQVGLTGKAVDPRLYIAVGIRGAANHTVGIKRAQTVVAINNDPEAPIFERADLGLVADWALMVPALIDALRMRLR